MKRSRLIWKAAALYFLGAGAALAQVTPLIGQIMPTAFQFCPSGWADANGQIMSIAQNTALFALFGTNFGGNGQTTFALPNLSGRVAGHSGQGPGLPSDPLGEETGMPSTSLTVAQMPLHGHAFNASPAKPDVKIPTAGSLPTFPAAATAYATSAPTVPMAKEAVTNTGEGQPFDQYQPSLVLRYCVALKGDFPKHN